jgi:phosphoribosylanthranilate isomerase
MKVKICGITNSHDAKKAITLGANALGFQLGMKHKTEDEISPQLAKKIISLLPPFVSSVMVTHLSDSSSIISLVKEIETINTIQFHDDIDAREVEKVKERFPQVRLIKAIHVDGIEALRRLHRYDKVVDAIIADSLNLREDRIGGTGMIHDWSITRRMVDESLLPIVLAGGLTPENVQDAIIAVRPYAIDVNSGVKIDRFSRRKDPVKMKNLIYRAKDAFTKVKVEQGCNNTPSRFPY